MRGGFCCQYMRVPKKHVRWSVLSDTEVARIPIVSVWGPLVRMGYEVLHSASDPLGLGEVNRILQSVFSPQAHASSITMCPPELQGVDLVVPHGAMVGNWWALWEKDIQLDVLTVLNALKYMGYSVYKTANYQGVGNSPVAQRS